MERVEILNIENLLSNVSFYDIKLKRIQKNFKKLFLYHEYGKGF